MTARKIQSVDGTLPRLIRATSPTTATPATTMPAAVTSVTG